MPKKEVKGKHALKIIVVERQCSKNLLKIDARGLVENQCQKTCSDEKKNKVKFLVKKLMQYDPVTEEEEDDSDEEAETQMREELNRSDEYSEESEVEEPEENLRNADDNFG